jgi:heme-degrading monooxygenase HmoA
VVTVGMYYDVIPEKASMFLARFREVVALLDRTPGHRATDLYQKVDDPHSFAMLSEWDDEDAFRKFIGSQTFRDVTAWGQEQVLRGRPRHKVYPRAEDVGRPS